MNALAARDDPRATAPFVTSVAAREWGGAPGAWRVVAASIVKERPGRRLALAFELEGPGGPRKLFGKAYASDRGRVVLGRLMTVHGSAGGPLVPRPLAYDSDLKLLLIEYIHGRPLADDLADGDAERAASRMGRTLAALRVVSGRNVGEWTVDDELANTLRHLDRMGPAHDRERRRAVSLLARIAPRLRDAAPDPPVVIHRDCYPDQFLDAGGATYLVDLDDMAVGDPAIDAGNFAAHLELRARQFPHAATAYGAARVPFFDAWASGFPGVDRPTLVRRCRWNEAAALIRLAAVYSARERWSLHLPEVLIECAAAAADGD